MMTLFPTTHFFYDSVIFSQERLKRFICQGHLVEWLQPSILSGVSHMEQIIFDSNYLLRSGTFLEDVKGSLFNHYNISHPSLEVVCLEINVSFLLVVPIFVTRCQLLLFVVTCCHSISLIVTQCTSRLCFYKHFVNNRPCLCIPYLSLLFLSTCRSG